LVNKDLIFIKYKIIFARKDRPVLNRNCQVFVGNGDKIAPLEEVPPRMYNGLVANKYSGSIFKIQIRQEVVERKSLISQLLRN
jgi:hypothetical protein